MVEGVGGSLGNTVACWPDPVVGGGVCGAQRGSPAPAPLRTRSRSPLVLEVLGVHYVVSIEVTHFIY